MKRTIFISAVVLFTVAIQGFANVYLDDGGTHNLNYTINDRVWVDYSVPSMQTTVNMFNEGFCWELVGYNTSRINVYGGLLYNNLIAYDSSHVTMSGGEVRQMFSAYGSSFATMYGGLTYDFYARDYSQINMSGGSVSHFLVTKDNSQATMSGGSVLELVTCQNSQLQISGGSWVWLEAQDNSRVIIQGSNFAINGIPVNLGEITSWGSSFRQLTGTLANGDIINNQFRLSTGAKLFLIPEPCTLLLFGLGGLALRLKCSKELYCGGKFFTWGI